MAETHRDESLETEALQLDGPPNLALTLEGLEGRIQAAVSIIQHLRKDRDLLKQELQEAKEIIHELQLRVEDTGDAGQQLAGLVRERDQLLQNRAVTARRLEKIIQRLGSLGIE